MNLLQHFLTSEIFPVRPEWGRPPPTATSRPTARVTSRPHRGTQEPALTVPQAFLSVFFFPRPAHVWPSVRGYDGAGVCAGPTLAAEASGSRLLRGERDTCFFSFANACAGRFTAPTRAGPAAGTSTSRGAGRCRFAAVFSPGSAAVSEGRCRGRRGGRPEITLTTWSDFAKFSAEIWTETRRASTRGATWYDVTPGHGQDKHLFPDRLHLQRESHLFQSPNPGSCFLTILMSAGLTSELS